ncbi:hypothetical protein IWQ60_010520 [Tieghemiomyces parasiticus]|uniref:rRNA-processing protein FYV7 n=1 Tax=Tieghemiomyces parasiticus TaxID=78921 RepID=A0A9W8DMN5_9FUNG|nr:hypothetical protein IWQ60_010520 [Tieghemiomyces parasiticus]
MTPTNRKPHVSHRERRRAKPRTGFPDTTVNKYATRVRKLKHKLVHNAQIKRKFYGEVVPSDAGNDAPDYIKQIFSQGSEQLPRFPGEGEGSESEEGSSDAGSEPQTAPTETVRSRGEMTSTTPTASESHRRSSEPARWTKPNPFQRAMQEADARRRQREEEHEKHRQEAEEHKQARLRSKRQRAKTFRKLTEKSQRGQPRLANHVDRLLAQIKKQHN